MLTWLYLIHESQRITEAHPLRNRNVCTRVHGNPSNSCCDISVWTRVEDWSKEITSAIRGIIRLIFLAFFSFYWTADGKRQTGNKERKWEREREREAGDKQQRSLKRIESGDTAVLWYASFPFMVPGHLSSCIILLGGFATLQLWTKVICLLGNWNVIIDQEEGIFFWWNILDDGIRYDICCIIRLFGLTDRFCPIPYFILNIT